MAGEEEIESARPTDVLHNSKDINVERAALGIIDVDAKMTVYVVLACTIAASGGLLFGEFGRPSQACQHVDMLLAYLTTTCSCHLTDAMQLCVH